MSTRCTVASSKRFNKKKKYYKVSYASEDLNPNFAKRWLDSHNKVEREII